MPLASPTVNIAFELLVLELDTFEVFGQALIRVVGLFNQSVARIERVRQFDHASDFTQTLLLC